MRLTLCAALAALISCSGTAADTVSPPPPTTSASSNDAGLTVEAVARLRGDLERAIADDGGKRGEHARQFVDAHIVALNEACASAPLATPLRAALVELVAALRDARGSGCLKSAIAGYAAGGSEIGAALRASAELRLKALAPDVMKAFKGFRFDDDRSKTVALDFSDALLATAGPAEERELVLVLDEPFSEIAATQARQKYAQSIAAQTLGELRSVAAVRPLFKLLLAPGKDALRGVALLALARIGPPSTQKALDVLRSRDPELVAQAAGLAGGDEAGRDALGIVAANVCSAIGDEPSASTLWSSTDSASPRVKIQIGRALSTVPKSERTLDAFKAIFEQTKPAVVIDAGPAKALLASGAAGFYDASVVPWLVKAALRASGDSSQVTSLRVSALQTAAKVMRHDQIADVQKLYDAKGVKEHAGDSFDAVFTTWKELARGCKDASACYEETLAAGDPAKVIKAVTMLAVLGDATAKKSLLQTSKSDDPNVRAATYGALLALSPKGDDEIARALEARVAEARASRDPDRVDAARLPAQIALKLRARAAP